MTNNTYARKASLLMLRGDVSSKCSAVFSLLSVFLLYVCTYNSPFMTLTTYPPLPLPPSCPPPSTQEKKKRNQKPLTSSLSFSFFSFLFFPPLHAPIPHIKHTHTHTHLPPPPPPLPPPPPSLPLAPNKNVKQGRSDPKISLSPPRSRSRSRSLSRANERTRKEIDRSIRSDQIISTFVGDADSHPCAGFRYRWGIHDYSPGGLSDANVHPRIHSFPLLGGGGGGGERKEKKKKTLAIRFTCYIRTYIHTYVTVCLLIIV